MHILFITIAWPRPGERNLYADLMLEFHKNGHEVFVLCADENISTTLAGYENGINVIRVTTSKVRKVNKLKKTLALFMLGWRLEKAISKNWPEIRVDLIISHSPPITLSGLFKSLKRKYKVPFYYLLKDIWPHGPVDLKLIRRHSIIYYYFRLHEISVYKNADFIGCMSPMNREYILKYNRYLSNDKVEVCPNSIIPRNLSFNQDKNQIRNKHNIPEHATVFIFSGNIGKAHGLEFYIGAIERLKDFDKAFFLIGGSGQYYNYAVKEINKRRMTNLGIYQRLPAEDFDALLYACDVGVILLDSNYSVPQFPSRLLAYLEAKKPILCSINAATDIGQIVEEAGCGISTLHGDMNEFSKAVKDFCSMSSESLDQMAANSYLLLQQRYTTYDSYNTIMQHFN